MTLRRGRHQITCLVGTALIGVLSLIVRGDASCALGHTFDLVLKNLLFLHLCEALKPVRLFSIIKVMKLVKAVPRRFHNISMVLVSETLKTRVTRIAICRMHGLVTIYVLIIFELELVLPLLFLLHVGVLIDMY